jgi:hypothetical protein
MSVRSVSQPSPGGVPPDPPAGEPAVCKPESAQSPHPSQSAQSTTPPVPGPVGRATVNLDQIDAEVALAKGPAGDHFDVELMSLSAKVNADQLTVQGAFSRIEFHSKDRAHSVSVEKLSFKAELGTTNPDGSVGINAGVGANLIGIEGTATYSGNSLTVGFAAGAGAEVSVGVRDFDKDGSPEMCARISVLFVTLGTCMEPLF